MPRGKSQEKKVFGPIVIDWSINATSILAFVISLFSLSLQGIDFWMGSEPTLHPAEKLLINTDGSTIRIGARMVYSNDGATGYNTLVMGESVRFKIDKKEVENWAEERGSFALEGGRPVLKEAHDAAPFIIPSTTLVTHESYFAARESAHVANRWADRVSRDRFVHALEMERQAGKETISFILQARIRETSGFNSGKESWLRTVCEITLDDGLIRRLNNEGWASRSCR